MAIHADDIVTVRIPLEGGGSAPRAWSSGSTTILNCTTYKVYNHIARLTQVRLN